MFILVCKSINDNNDSVEDSEESEGDWITQDNFDDVLLKNNDGTIKLSTNEKIKVACLSTDFSIQNVLIHMKLNIVSLDGFLIKQLKSYVLRCRLDIFFI